MTSFAAATAAGAGAPAAVFLAVAEIANNMADGEEKRHQEYHTENERCHRESLPFQNIVSHHAKPSKRPP